MRSDARAGALSRCNIQVWFSHNSGLFQPTASLKRAKTFWYSCLFTIWPRGTNSWWTMPFQSKNTSNNTLIFDLFIRAFGVEGRGDPSPVCLGKQLKCLCKLFTKFATKFHTQTHCSSSCSIVTLSLIRRTDCARAQFSGCSSTTYAHSETGQMAVYCQNLTLGALSSRIAISVLVGALFKKFGLFLNTPRILILLRVRNVSHKSCVEKSKLFSCSKLIYFRKSCRLWDNMGEYYRAKQATNDNIIGRMRNACYITKATNIRPEYETLVSCTQQKWLCKSTLTFRHRASCI